MDISPKARSAAGRRGIIPYVEAVLMVGGLLALQLWTQSAYPGFTGWPFDFYLIPVLLLSARYGTVAGVVTAALAVMAELTAIAKGAGGVASLKYMGASQGGSQLLLILSAVVTGALRDHHVRLLRSSISSHDELESRFDRLSAQYTLLLDEKHLVDAQVLTDEQTFDSLAELFSDLDRIEPGQFPARVLSLALKIMGGGQAAIYQLRSDWEMEALTSGAADRQRLALPPAQKAEEDEDIGSVAAGVLLRDTGSKWPRGLEISNPVIERALATGRATTLAEVVGWDDLEAYQREIIHLACPIPVRWSRSRLLLVVKSMPFAAFSPSRIQGLTVALAIATRAIRRARILRKLKLHNLDSLMTHASSLVRFNSGLGAVLERASGVGGRAFLVKLRVAPTLPPGLENQRQQLRDGLARYVRQALKRGQLVAHMYKRGALMILCPDVEDVEARHFCDDLRRRIAESLSRTGPLVPPAAFHVTMLDLDPKVYLGREGRRAHGRA
jgi:hypothetical protein